MNTKTITIKPNSQTRKWEVWHPDRVEDKEIVIRPKVGLCSYNSDVTNAQDAFNELKLNMIQLHNQEIIRLSKSLRDLIKLELPKA